MFKNNYLHKYQLSSKVARVDSLDQATEAWLGKVACRYLFTQQELKQLVEVACDFSMWYEMPLPELWQKCEAEINIKGRERKKLLFKKVTEVRDQLIQNKSYLDFSANYSEVVTTIPLPVYGESQKILGMCPAHSDKTLCCRLLTLDAVKNCGYGCSYCAIQTMFADQPVVFAQDLARQLAGLQLDKQKFYHIGTGQSSDALLWGNRQNLLSDLCKFASQNPNVLLEMKTKSANIKYFTQNVPAKNVVCTWSVNTPTIINHEEHFTATLAERLNAARTIADLGMKIGLHFHPVVWYVGWQDDYSELVAQIQARFTPQEILFISIGTLTFPRPVIKKIRSYGYRSKILQMPFALNPEGKLTYPDEIKMQLFRHVYSAFRTWHGQVFFYLCMEESKFWHDCFGSAYQTNEAFEKALLDWSMARIG